MKYETYCALLSVIHQHLRPGDRKKCMNVLTKSYPDIDPQSLGSIYSQEILKKVKKTFHKHAKLAEQYYRRFEAMSNDPSVSPYDVIIFNIAKEIEFPPSMLAKMIVERHLWWKKKCQQLKAQSESARESGEIGLIKEVGIVNGEHRSTVSSSARDTEERHGGDDDISVSKQETNKALRNPESLISENARLASEVHLCNVLDDDYGPVSDMIKQSIGHEKEVYLKRRAKELGLVFKDEDQMRAEGFDKTPDLRLEIPVAIEGVVIHWIESKASFGDESTHSVYLKDQFWSYQNRFGPGIVIYWFGFIEELDVNRSKGILLFDHLPENFVHFDPDKL